MKPTRPGSYWYRQDAIARWEKIEVVGAGISGYGSTLFALVPGHEEPFPIDKVSGEWADVLVEGRSPHGN